MKRRAFYRVLVVALAVAIVLPRYWLLLFRERWPFARPSAAAWDRVHRRAASVLHWLGVHLAGMFVKVCQIVGARADVFPRPFIETLGRFHDRAPARPFAHLGIEVPSAIESVQPEPIAAASLAQVHRAQLSDGAPVVIKIQYPEIARLARVDLASLRRVARVTARMQNRLDLASIAEEVAKFVALELDFVREAESTERVRAAFGESSEVRVPVVYREHCSQRVLVLEHLDGVRVTDFAALERAGHDRIQVAERIARIYATMIFEHGFFHGDPHPGNLLVLPDGKIGLLDFGLAKELPPGFAAGVLRMLLAFATGDADAMTRHARDLGFDLGETRPEALVALVQKLLGDSIGGESMVELLERTSVKKVPDHFGLIVRTLIILNGLSHSLVPGERVIQREMMRALSSLALSENAA